MSYPVEDMPHKTHAAFFAAFGKRCPADKGRQAGGADNIWFVCSHNKNRVAIDVHGGTIVSSGMFIVADLSPVAAIAEWLALSNKAAAKAIASYRDELSHLRAGARTIPGQP